MQLKTKHEAACVDTGRKLTLPAYCNSTGDVTPFLISFLILCTRYCRWDWDKRSPHQATSQMEWEGGRRTGRGSDGRQGERWRGRADCSLPLGVIRLDRGQTKH